MVTLKDLSCKIKNIYNEIRNDNILSGLFVFFLSSFIIPFLIDLAKKQSLFTTVREFLAINLFELKVWHVLIVLLLFLAWFIYKRLKNNKVICKSHQKDVDKENSLAIDEYTNEGEVIKNSSSELKKIYSALKQYPDFPILEMINDLRRIQKYHKTNHDLCLELVKNEYPMRWIHSTVFVTCIELIIDNNSDFIYQLRLESFYRRLHKTAQQKFISTYQKKCNNEKQYNDINKITSHERHIIKNTEKIKWNIAKIQ